MTNDEKCELAEKIIRDVVYGITNDTVRMKLDDHLWGDGVEVTGGEFDGLARDIQKLVDNAKITVALPVGSDR